MCPCLPACLRPPNNQLPAAAAAAFCARRLLIQFHLQPLQNIFIPLFGFGGGRVCFGLHQDLLEQRTATQSRSPAKTLAHTTQARIGPILL